MAKLMDLLPKTIRVGPYDYEVSVVERLMDTDGTKLDGHIRHKQGTIAVDAESCQQYAFQTLWHEALHAILIVAGRLEDTKNEGLIEAVGSGIMQVLRDNPALRNPPKGR